MEESCFNFLSYVEKVWNIVAYQQMDEETINKSLLRKLKVSS